MLNRIVPMNSSLVRPLSACLRHSSTNPVVAEMEKEKKLSRAMKYYMEKRRNYEEFIAQERSEFELGKKHLANMMGMEAEAMTQEDIDKAIGKFMNDIHLKIFREINSQYHFILPKMWKNEIFRQINF